MAEWVPAASIADCPPGSTIEVVVQSQVIALVNIDGQLYALDGICPHQGGPLGKGSLDAAVLTCPWHGWQFDVPTGTSRLNPASCQQRFPVRVEGDTILVLVDAGAGLDH